MGGHDPPAAPVPHLDWNGRAVRRLWVAVVIMMIMMMLAQDGSHEVTKHRTGRLTRDDTSSKASLKRKGSWLR